MSNYGKHIGFHNIRENGSPCCIYLSCNMDYYLKTNHEIEKDLNRNKSKDGDDKIFFEKAFILKDFHMLFMDGNYRMATARRGNYYLIFKFVNWFQHKKFVFVCLILL